MCALTMSSSSDTCNSSSVVLDSDTSTAGCGNTYSETRTWHAVDACNNTSAQVHQTITVVDTTNPTITQPADGTVECPAMPVFTEPRSEEQTSELQSRFDIESRLLLEQNKYGKTRTGHPMFTR